MQDMQDWKHPELQEGERFIGNFTLIQFRKIGQKGKRLGEKAFTKDGIFIPPYALERTLESAEIFASYLSERLFPVFVTI